MSVANLHETSPDFDQASPKVGGGVVTDDSATLFLKLADWARAMSDKDDSDDGNGEEFGFLPRFPVYDEDKLAIEEICSLFRTHLSGMQPAHIALAADPLPLPPRALEGCLVRESRRDHHGANLGRRASHGCDHHRL